MQKTIGAFIFPEIWQTWDERQALNIYDALKDMGVNCICTESESYRNDLIDLCHQKDLKWFGGISCFSDHANQHQIVKEHPELHPINENGKPRAEMEWYLGVTPTYQDYSNTRLDLAAQLVSAYEMDGFFLDFIRWPIHWELELRPTAPPPLQSSFDSHTLACFQNETKLEIPSDLPTTSAKADWILSNHFELWVNFKCAIITRFVSQMSEQLRSIRPKLALGMYVLPMPMPQMQSIAGQNLCDLAPFVDWIAPMVYHAIVHRDISWVKEIRTDVFSQVGRKTLPVLQVDSSEGKEMGADWGLPIPRIEWEELLNETLRETSIDGLIAFTGTALFRDGRGEVLSNILKSI